MSVLNKEDLIKAITTAIGNNTDDASIQLLEDVSDTYDDAVNKQGGEDWKSKYEENDKAWREKYVARFSEPSKEHSNILPNTQPDTRTEEEKKAEAVSFDDIFKS